MSSEPPLADDLLVLLVAGAVAARPLGRAETPHWKHSTGTPFLSLRRCASLSSGIPRRLKGTENEPESPVKNIDNFFTFGEGVCKTLYQYNCPLALDQL